MKGKYISFLLGIATGAALVGGAAAAGVLAEPSWSPIYVDGRQVQMTAYNIAGNNYVKLRDIGQAVGFNVYYQNGVQVDSTAPYTGEAPATAQTSVNVSSYKGNTLTAGDRSGLIIGPSGTYAVTSGNPAVVSVENVSGSWVAVAKSAGTAVIVATDRAGVTGTLALTVEESAPAAPAPAPSGGIDLSANMDVRQEMVRLINQTRRENGAAELPVNEALMKAAQDLTAGHHTSHNTRLECETVLACGYPYGFGTNLTAFTGASSPEIAQRAVRNWINSSGHFQTMVNPDADSLGAGVTVYGGWTYCYMIVGNSNSHNPYA